MPERADICASSAADNDLRPARTGGSGTEPPKLTRFEAFEAPDGPAGDNLVELKLSDGPAPPLLPSIVLKKLRPEAGGVRGPDFELAWFDELFMVDFELDESSGASALDAFGGLAARRINLKG